MIQVDGDENQNNPQQSTTIQEYLLREPELLIRVLLCARFRFIFAHDFLAILQGKAKEDRWSKTAWISNIKKMPKSSQKGALSVGEILIAINQIIKG